MKKNDFIEIEFTGKTKDGEIFDSNIKEDLERANLKTPPKPFVFALGQKMFLQGVEDFLIGKKLGEYNIDLPAEKAFGKRNLSLIQRIPQKIFKEHNIQPVKGVAFNFDNKVGKILAISGGRVVVDFNNPLAGKDVTYKIKVKRNVEDLNEKIKSMNEFLFRKEVPFEVKEKKLILQLDKQMSQFAILFKQKYKELFDLDLEVKEVEEKTNAQEPS